MSQPVSVAISANAARCLDENDEPRSGPCNNATGRYHIAGLALEAGDYEAPLPAFGDLPQYWAAYDDYAFPHELGCHGADVELRCAPAVPAAITEVVGIVRLNAAGAPSVVVEFVEFDDVAEQQKAESLLLPPAEYRRMPAGCGAERCGDLLDPSGIEPEVAKEDPPIIPQG